MNIEYHNASYREHGYYGKRVPRVEASCGTLREHGRTKTEAKQALEAAIEAQLEHVYTRRRYLSAPGVTFALYYAGGWCYDIVREGRVACSTGLDAANEHEALDRMRRHFEQYVEVVPTP